MIAKLTTTNTPVTSSTVAIVNIEQDGSEEFGGLVRFTLPSGDGSNLTGMDIGTQHSDETFISVLNELFLLFRSSKRIVNFKTYCNFAL